MATLFEHLDRVETRERPLRPIRHELRSDASYVRTDEGCPVDGCEGALWADTGPGSDRICGECSAVDGADGPERTMASARTTTASWSRFQRDRPRYRNSNRRRQVGGFGHEWADSDDLDRPVGELDPEEFYASE